MPALSAPGIRPAHPSDLPALLALESASFARDVAFGPRQLRRLTRSGRVLVAADARQVVGQITVLRRRYPGFNHVRIYNLAVAPRSRGRGIGRRLVEAALAAFVDGDTRRISLEVAAGSPAVAFYERLGFVLERRLAGYYGARRSALRMVHPGRPAPHGRGRITRRTRPRRSNPETSGPAGRSGRERPARRRPRSASS